MTQLVVYRDDQTLLYDASYTTYSVARSGTVYTQSPTRTATATSTVLVPINPAADEITAIQGPYTFARGSNVNINGQWFDCYQTTAPIGTGFRWWTYNRASARPDEGGNSGVLKLYDNNGTLTFNSNQRQLVIGGKCTGLGSAVAMKGDRSYAAIFTTWGGRQAQNVDSVRYQVEGSRPPQYYYEYTMDSKLYGVGFYSTAYNGASIVRVSHNDTSGIIYSSTRPPSSVDWDVDLGLVLFADVTGL